MDAASSTPAAVDVALDPARARAVDARDVDANGGDAAMGTMRTMTPMGARAWTTTDAHGMARAMPWSTDALGAKRAIDVASAASASRDHPRAKRRDVDGAAEARGDATARLASCWPTI